MVRSELIARVAEQNPALFARDVEALVTVILNRIETALIEGDRVELRDFGTFCVREREARNGRNPRTGETVAVEAKAHVHFKPGKGMRARLNLEKDELREEAEQLLRAS